MASLRRGWSVCRRSISVVGLIPELLDGFVSHGGVPLLLTALKLAASAAGDLVRCCRARTRACVICHRVSA
jgi:hypothetical protein